MHHQLRIMYLVVDQHTVGLNKRRPEGPLLGASILHQVDRAFPLRGFAIKYVIQGVERYTLNGMPYAVGAGEYVLANGHCTGHIRIDSERPVIGLCADLPHAMMENAVAAMADPEALEGAEGPLFFTTSEFLENRYAGEGTFTGRLMQGLASTVERALYADHTITASTYFTLAEAVINDHRSMVPELRHVPSVRTGTRKEIYRRLLRARDLIHAQFGAPLTVTELAAASAMSEFHFFRSFRAVFGATPHQYLRTVRLERARDMLQRQSTSVTLIAEQCGFADIHSFSKAFKQHFGQNPSMVRGATSRL